MAIDTVGKRASATCYYPMPSLVWPAGTVSRQAATWIYSGIAAGAPSNPAYELFAATSEILTNLAWMSYLLPTLAKDSTIVPTVSENSRI